MWVLNQNHQKVCNRVFTFGQGPWHSENLIKSPLIYSRSYSVWRGWSHQCTPCRTVARKSSVGGFTFGRGGFTFVQGDLTIKFAKNSTIYNVSYFNLGGLELCLGGKVHQSPPVATGLSPWRRKWFELPLCCHYWKTYEKLQSSNQVRLSIAQ